MDARGARPHIGLTQVQYLLILIGEAAWIYPWVLALGMWFGEDRKPILPFSFVFTFLMLAALGSHLLAFTTRRFRRARVLLVLLGVTAACLVGLGQLPAFRVESHWVEVWNQLAQPSFEKQVAMAAALVIFLWWRGITVGRSQPNLSSVQHEFRMGILALAGLLVVVRAVVAMAGEAFAPPAGSLILAALLVVFVGLVGTPLARIVDESERTRQQDVPSLAPRGPWLAMLLGVVSTILLVTLLLAQLLTFERISFVLAPLWEAVGAVVQTLVYIVSLPSGLLVEAIIYLIRLLLSLARFLPSLGRPQTEAKAPDLTWLQELRPHEQPGVIAPQLLLDLKVVLAVGLGVAVIWGLLRAVSRLADRWQQDEVEEIRDFVWSWPGLKAVWSWLLAQFHPSRPGPALVRRERPEDMSMAQSVRELYRAFLALGAAVGRARRPVETPLEYERRLNGDDPLPGGDEVRSITDSYIQARYAPPASKTPDLQLLASALVRLRALWHDRLSA